MNIKIFKNTKAFTLMEIIVASMIVAVAMLGIITSNISLQKNAQDTSNAFYVASMTQQMLNQILLDASLAVGTGSNPGVAIATGTAMGNGYNTVSTGDAKSFCFYHYDPANTTNPGSWACYTWDSSSNGIYYCTRSSAGACSTSTAFLGKSKDPFSLSSNPNFIMTTTASGHQRVLFYITLENCLDPSNLNCCDPSDSVCTSSANPPDSSNPYVKKGGGVSPSGVTAS